MDKPVVSVIIPNYNHARYLPQRIESVLNQTFTDFEVLLLDDCSSDNSREIIEQYAKQDKRIQVLFNEQNSGSTFKQWNKGVREARGEYIWFAESDDYAERELLEKLVAQLGESPDTVLAYCQSWSVNEQNKILNTLRQDTDDLDAYQFTHDFYMKGEEYLLKYLIYKNTIPNASAVLFRKEKYFEVGGADETIKVSSDWRFWIKLLQRGSLRYINKELNYYRTHSNTVRENAMQKGDHILEHFKMIIFIFNQVALTVEAKERLIHKANSVAKQWLKTASLVKSRENEEIFAALAKIDEDLAQRVKNKLFKKFVSSMVNGKLKTVVRVLQKKGVSGLFSLAYYKVTGNEPMPESPLKNYEIYYRLLKGKKGLEIGGPSRIFQKKDLLPIYPVVKELDGCNFSNHTVWEGEIKAGLHYKFDPDKTPGRQYICEASNLVDVPAKTYDFILSSHSIEHIANPLKAIEDWLRVLKNNGMLLMVVPHKKGTFDHQRPVTSFTHLLADYQNQTDEHDLTHLSEILELHDLSMDPPAGTIDAFRARSLKNFENRCLHHHVFDASLVVEIFTHFNMQIKAINIVKPYHIIVLGVKTEKNVDNSQFLNNSREEELITFQ